MELLKEADFRKLLKGGLQGGYLFFGDEDYLKQHALRSAREAVCTDPSLAFFNEVRLDGTDFQPSALLDALAAMPMLTEQKIVTVTGLDFGALKAAELDALCDVLEQLPSYPYAVLILCAPAGGFSEGYLPKRPSPLLLRLAALVTPVQFETCTPAKLATWVARHFNARGVAASPEVCSRIIAYCGSDMYTLAFEIEKVSLYVQAHGRAEATEQDLYEAAAPDFGYDAFALTNAILERRTADALEYLNRMMLQRVEPVIVLGEISKTCCELLTVKALAAEGRTAAEITAFTKINPYKVTLYTKRSAGLSSGNLRRTVALCARADAALKQGAGAGSYLPIEKLLCTL
jgi:DNA polymerase-3 subunit delta